MPFDPSRCFCAGACRAQPAIALNAQGEHERAMVEARRAVLLAPSCPEAHGFLGFLMSNQNAAFYAEPHLRMAKGFGNRPAVTDTNLGHCLIAQGRLDAAEGAFAEAIQANPSYLPAHVGLAKVAELKGEYEKGLGFIDRMGNHDVSGCRLIYGKLLAALDRYEDAVNILSVKPDIDMVLERGKIHEKFGDFDRAWADYVDGKRMAGPDGKVKTYDDTEAQLRIANHRTFATISTLDRLPRLAGGGGPLTPIFITGFPRSGTTLLETMLGRHPKIHAGDELKFLYDIAGMAQAWLGAEQPYPFALEELAIGDKLATLRAFRAYYISKAWDVFDPQKLFMTDKMPLNEMHLPLISLLFPEAPIVHLRRHPLDVVVSNVSTYLTHGFNQAFDPVSSAIHYARVDELVAHYRNKVEMRLVDVRYESLVDNPEPEIRRILDAAPLAFEPACLEPEKSRHHPRTPSYAAVKQPIHTRAVERWRKFEKYLDAPKRILEPILAREGY